MLTALKRSRLADLDERIELALHILATDTPEAIALWNKSGVDAVADEAMRGLLAMQRLYAAMHEEALVLADGLGGNDVD